VIDECYMILESMDQ
jgi:superfamily II DNA/RNA helicase